MSQANNPFLLNIVPIFNVADPTNGAGSGELTTSVTGIQTMIDFTTHTLSADYIQPFTAGQTVQMTGNFNVVGTLSVDGVQLGPNGNGENFLYGSNITLDSGSASIVLSNVSTGSATPAITFYANSVPAFEIDSLGRALYQGDGVSSNVNRLWVSSAIMYADRGAIGLGGSSNVSTIFDVWNGDAYFNQNVNVNSNVYCRQLFQFSDERLKADIEPVRGALSTVCELKGVHYTMDGEAQVGFIAQEVQRILPEAVRVGGGLGMLSVDYTRVVPLLVEAIKELSAQIESLRPN